MALLFGCAHYSDTLESREQVHYYDRNGDGKVDDEVHHYLGATNADWELCDDKYVGRYDEKIVYYGVGYTATSVDIPVPTGVKIETQMPPLSSAPREPPYYRLADESHSYLIMLHDSGKLPGIQSDEIIQPRWVQSYDIYQMKGVPLDFAPSGEVDYMKPVVYPVTFTYIMSPYRQRYKIWGEPFELSDGSFYYYLVKKDSKSSRWRLVKACRQKLDGKVEDLAIQ